MEKRKSEEDADNRKRAKTTDSKSKEDLFESSVGYIFPSDVEVALYELRKKFPKEKFCNKIPPLIFVHQLGAKHNMSQSHVLEEIDRLQKLKKIKHLKVNPELRVVFFVEDLKDLVFSQFNPTGRPKYFLNKVLPSLDSYIIEKSLLKNEYRLSEKDITELVQFGLLVFDQENTYTISFPGLGQFMKTFYDGRKALLNLIKKSKYKELLLSEIKGRALKPLEILGIDYHLSDVIGAKLVTWYVLNYDGKN